MSQDEVIQLTKKLDKMVSKKTTVFHLLFMVYVKLSFFSYNVLLLKSSIYIEFCLRKLLMNNIVVLVMF